MNKNQKTKKILLIDDSDMLIRLLDRFFTDTEFEFLHAKNAIIGLKLLQEKSADLVLCDMNLPFKSGIQFLEEKNSIASLKSIPVMMLTVDRSAKTVKTAAGLGVVDFIIKPFNLEDLEERIYSLWNINKKDMKENNMKTDFIWDEDVFVVTVAGEITKKSFNQLKYKLMDETRLIDNENLKIILRIEKAASIVFETDIFSFLSYIFFTELKMKNAQFIIQSKNDALLKSASALSSSAEISINGNYCEAMNSLAGNRNAYYKELELADIADNLHFEYPLYNADGEIVLEKSVVLNKEKRMQLIKNSSNTLYYKNSEKELKTHSYRNYDELITLERSSIFDAALSGKRVLITEDSPTLRLHIGNSLRKFGLLVFYAENGKEAITQMAEHSPDIILLDLYMPVMNGGAFLNYIVKNKLSIPIIIMSATPMNHLSEPMNHPQVTGYISKPFKMSELIDKIKLAFSP